MNWYLSDYTDLDLMILDAGIGKGYKTLQMVTRSIFNKMCKVEAGKANLMAVAHPKADLTGEVLGGKRS